MTKHDQHLAQVFERCIGESLTSLEIEYLKARWSTRRVTAILGYLAVQSLGITYAVTAIALVGLTKGTLFFVSPITIAWLRQWIGTFATTASLSLAGIALFVGGLIELRWRRKRRAHLRVLFTRTFVRIFSSDWLLLVMVAPFSVSVLYFLSFRAGLFEDFFGDIYWVGFARGISYAVFTALSSLIFVRSRETMRKCLRVAARQKKKRNQIRG